MYLAYTLKSLCIDNNTWIRQMVRINRRCYWLASETDTNSLRWPHVDPSIVRLQAGAYCTDQMESSSSRYGEVSLILDCLW